MKVYVLDMLRWGEEDTHHYINGVFTTEEQAKFAGEVEKSWRGGKYDYRIVEIELDRPVDQEKWKHYIRSSAHELIQKEKAA